MIQLHTIKAMGLDPINFNGPLFSLSKSEIVHGRSRAEQQEPPTTDDVPDESNCFESRPLTKRSILNIVQRAERSAATYGFAGGAVSTAVIFAAMMSLRLMIACDAANEMMHNIPPSQGFVQSALSDKNMTERDIIKRSLLKDLDPALQKLSDRQIAIGKYAKPAVVLVKDPSIKNRTLGSGFIYNSDGIIVTNHHVVSESSMSTVQIQLYDGSEISGQVIGEDRDKDIAVIKISRNNLPALELATSEVEPGSIAIAVGYQPGCCGWSMSTGIVSAINRNVGNSNPDNLLQTDAAINPGSSGSPLLNLSGKVIAINTLWSGHMGYQNVNFGIPAKTAQEVIVKIMKSRK